jgi:membrane protein involved in D-alanine export
MIPYADFTWFALLLYPVLATVALGLFLRLGWRWILFWSGVALLFQYSGTLKLSAGIAVRELWIVIGYGAYEWLVACAFLRVRGRVSGRWPLGLAVLIAVLPLAAAKFVPAIAPGSSFGFLGISYVTFRILDVLFCVNDRLISTLPAAQFFGYLFFFAPLSSGPIDRYRRFETDWTRTRSRAEFLDDLDGGMHRVFTGFLYKFILAALIKEYWMDPAAAREGAPAVVSYMYAYSFYLFFDFAGYSLFAIGVSYFFGIHTPENFDRPFLARNIKEFWNRWHITLSWWFRDHIYMRFFLAASKGRWFKNKHLGSYLGFFLSFGLMGLWHGAQAHYIVYGLYHATMLVGYDMFSRWNKERKLLGKGWVSTVLSTGLTFNAVCFGFLIFSGHLGQKPAAAHPAATVAPAKILDTLAGPEGYVEKADATTISGWAWDSAHPNTVIAVEIFEGTRWVAKVTADRLRPWLATTGHGDGRHGFVYRVPRQFRDGKPHTLSVNFAGTSIPLTSGIRTVQGQPALATDFDGSLDGFDPASNSILGWAFDRENPSATVYVDLYENGTLLAKVPADVFRQDLAKPGLGEGRHGFIYPIPANFADGKPHIVKAVISGAGVELRDSPKPVYAKRPKPPGNQPQEKPAAGAQTKFWGNIDVANCERIDLWVWDEAQPDLPLQVEIYDGQTLLVRATADALRKDLKSEKGNGKHGLSYRMPASIKDGKPHVISVKVAGTEFAIPGSPKTVVCPRGVSTP